MKVLCTLFECLDITHFYWITLTERATIFKETSDHGLVESEHDGSGTSVEDTKNPKSFLPSLKAMELMCGDHERSLETSTPRSRCWLKG